jgi:hypothetical protein
MMAEALAMGRSAATRRLLLNSSPVIDIAVHIASIILRACMFLECRPFLEDM